MNCSPRFPAQLSPLSLLSLLPLAASFCLANPVHSNPGVTAAGTPGTTSPRTTAPAPTPTPVPAPAILKVSADHRFLVTDKNQPFFYLGDTAWELFHRLNREEAVRYLKNRAEKGFTVIQAVALAELDGLKDPNAYGHLPLTELDPTRPAVVEGAENDYWDHVDFIVREANRLGLTIAFLPTWGDKWFDRNGSAIFTPENAETYGEWLGKRYKDAAIIWVLGGDRPVDTDVQRAVIQAMAKGLARGDEGRHLKSFHPPGGAGSSQWFQEADWLDFNMRQNGHVVSYTETVPQVRGYFQTKQDYDRTPIKPVLDAEPLYEDHPINFNAGAFGHSIASDIRRPLYWDLFSGACGHTYGNHAVWQMAAENHAPVNNPLMHWYQAVDQPGAGQMQYGRWLMESRPWQTFVPDQGLIEPEKATTSVPGAGRYFFAGTRAADGGCAMVYVPAGRGFRVRLEKITGAQARAWWFNPRNGEATEIGVFPTTGPQLFSPPEPGEALDWVLVLDAVDREFGPPGMKP